MKTGVTENPKEQETIKENIMELKNNIAAVLGAVVVNFILGFIWYTHLFGKIWLILLEI